MSNSNRPAARRKPEKPYKGFPIFAHPSGQWAKKIRQKLYYFGVWAEPEAALERLNREYPYRKEGREPPAVDVSGGCTLQKLCNEFLHSKKDNLEAGELSPHTFRDYFRTCELLIEHLGKDRRVDDLRPDPLCRSGMRWSRGGGQHILSLRTYVKSNRWNAMWCQYKRINRSRSVNITT